ncbi:ATP-grasp domain-containing protein [Jiangella rhizosphaerae]|uniref:ATP-grasp domain-containing protein n=1 Tax=Jiangella rhizosphaerae TaxID=2293569 RepID=A0A418KNL9_9ACTN|nr:hypothetical protein [Jiangella rhizosphaerae]RIQ20555.1 hypothetical protein DY240_17350 [Jiangella rhizosphaerae]
MPRVALVTCADLPHLDTDDQLVVQPLRALGVDVETPVWDDPAVDWAAFDLAVLRNPWDYARRREPFLAWAHAVPRLLNPPKVVEWNTDKVYLRELAAAGLPVVPTTWLTPGDAATELPGSGEYVLKPSVSAGSADTGRYRLDDAEQRALAVAQVEKLLARGSTVMLQPYLEAVDTAGETAMLHIGGEFSHAIRKGALLDGPDLRDGKPLWSEQIDPREPTPAEAELARRTLDAIPGSDTLLYARVDTIPGADGAPVILEVELTEPSLFLATSPGAPERLARAIAARL